MRLIYNVHRKKQGGEKVIDSIAHADKNPKEVTRWITDVATIQRHPPSVAYTKAFPEIDNLMQVNGRRFINE
jgi:intraflagellar transport protein 46